MNNILDAEDIVKLLEKLEEEGCVEPCSDCIFGKRFSENNNNDDICDVLNKVKKKLKMLLLEVL